VHSSKHSKTLTASITTKVTPEEQQIIRQRAQEAGLRPSEWCRQVLLSGLIITPETSLILSELLAVRKVFLALLIDLAQGQKPTEQRIREVVENGEATKLAMAESRIHAFRSQKPNE
jgi:hypothetical protein